MIGITSSCSNSSNAVKHWPAYYELKWLGPLSFSHVCEQQMKSHLVGQHSKGSEGTFAESNTKRWVQRCSHLSDSKYPLEMQPTVAPVPAILESLSCSPSGGPNFITVQFIYQHSFTVWADLQVASLFGNEQTLNYIVSHCKLAFNSDCNSFLFLPLCGPVSWPLQHLTAFLSIQSCKFNQPQWNPPAATSGVWSRERPDTESFSQVGIEPATLLTASCQS